MYTNWVLGQPNVSYSSRCPHFRSILNKGFLRTSKQTLMGYAKASSLENWAIGLKYFYAEYSHTYKFLTIIVFNPDGLDARHTQ